MRIPLSAPDLTEADIQAVAEVLRSTQLSLGPRLADFEKIFGTAIGTAHAVAVSSGTAALHLCFKGLGLGEGDEVITSPFSFIASANAILFERATPVFVDIDASNLNLDPSRIESAITKNTKAILPVHVFGRPANLTAILKVARKYSLPVIEDACEALGAEWNGVKAGAHGRAGVFGFYPNKLITTGEGGMLVTGDEELASLARSLRNQGRVDTQDWYQHQYLGYNYRLSEMQCELGRRQMDRLPQILQRREEAARHYHRRLAGNPNLVVPPINPSGEKTSWFLFVVRLTDRFTREDRDRMVQEMGSRGIGCGRYFAPIHLQPYYRETFGFSEGAFPITERVADRCLALPFFTRITEQQIDEVCSTLVALIPARGGT